MDREAQDYDASLLGSLWPHRSLAAISWENVIILTWGGAYRKSVRKDGDSTRVFTYIQPVFNDIPLDPEISHYRTAIFFFNAIGLFQERRHYATERTHRSFDREHS